MTNSSIEYQIKRKKFYESKCRVDRSFKTLSTKWVAPRRLRGKLLPDLTIYPKEWTYLVSIEKRAHTITLDEFRQKNLSPGDKVYFERGHVYNFVEYDLTVNNITFGAFGAGADPVFLGSTDIGSQTWTSEGSDQFSTSWSSPVKWVFVDGVAARLAETPWYKITAQADATHLTASTLNGAWGTSVSGASVLVREWYFTYSHLQTVTAYSAGQITLSDGVRTGLTEFTFKLYNMRQFMSQEFDFFHDSGANTLYYQTSGSTPAGSNIRVCTEDHAINIGDGVQNFVCDGIEFSEYFNSAIKGFESDGFQMRNCNVNNIRTNGVFIYGATTGVVIEDNTFSKCGNNGMYLGGLVNPTVQNNTMTTFGRERTHPFPLEVASMSDWQQTTASGIVFTYDLFNTVDFGVDGGTVTENTISDCGYCGINWTGSLAEVSYNRVDEVMLDVEDGAGIYCIAQPELPAYGTITDGTLITKNIVTNVRGRYDNCPLSHPTFNSWGIYIDKSCTNISILNNTVHAPDAGGLIKFNFDCHDNIIRDNILVGGIYGVQFNTWNDAPYTVNDGNQMTGNVIATAWYSITSNRIADGSEHNPFANGGDVNNNFYLNNYGDVVFRKLNATAASRTLASWKTFTGDDASSVGFPITRYNFSGNFAAEQEMIIELNETDSPVLFPVPVGYVDKSGTTAGNNVTIPAREGVVFVRTASVATVYDGFSGTNGTSISGRTPDGVGGNWTLHNGAISITSNAMVSSSSGNATVNTSDTDANVFVNANKGTTGNINILLRHNGLNGTSVEDYIWIFWGSNAISLIQHTGSTGTDVTLASAPHELPASTSCYLEAQIVGNRVKVKAGLANAANETRIDYTGVTMNPSSTRFGFRQTITGSSNTTTFAISSP